MNERTYSWSIASAIYQMQNGLPGSDTTNSAHEWLKDKIENGSATEINDIAERLFDAVAALTEKG